MLACVSPLIVRFSFFSIVSALTALLPPSLCCSVFILLAAAVATPVHRLPVRCVSYGSVTEQAQCACTSISCRVYSAH